MVICVHSYIIRLIILKEQILEYAIYCVSEFSPFSVLVLAAVCVRGWYLGYALVASTYVRAHVCGMQKTFMFCSLNRNSCPRHTFTERELSYSKKPSHCMKSRRSLAFLLESVIGAYPEAIESSLHPPTILLSDPFGHYLTLCIQVFQASSSFSGF
jgi:hypothetical protein